MGLFEIIRLGSILSVIRYTAHRGYAYWDTPRAPMARANQGKARAFQVPGGYRGRAAAR